MKGNTMKKKKRKGGEIIGFFFLSEGKQEISKMKTKRSGPLSIVPIPKTHLPKATNL